MLEKVIENWTSRLDYIRASLGSLMPEIIFKIVGGDARWRESLDKELWRLGPDGRVCFGVLCANRTRKVKRDFVDLE
ncbi:hypothetical protein TNCV_311321 [Trichonephila clavipes]|nr:hypothetical protein TNCV_311321 [Trichonephila clavipes]